MFFRVMDFWLIIITAELEKEIAEIADSWLQYSSFLVSDKELFFRDQIV